MSEETKTELIERVIDLRRTKRRLEEWLNSVRKDLAPLEAELVEEWSSNGTEQVKKDGATVYLSRNLSVRITDRERLVEALRQVAPDLLTANNRSLVSFCKEQFERDDIGDWAIDPARLPPGVADALEFSEYTRVNVRGL